MTADAAATIQLENVVRLPQNPDDRATPVTGILRSIEFD